MDRLGEITPETWTKWNKGGKVRKVVDPKHKHPPQQFSEAFRRIDGTLESILVKHPNAKRGIRLIKTDSIRRYLASFKA
jgi:hypothetical protein